MTWMKFEVNVSFDTSNRIIKLPLFPKGSIAYHSY